MPGKDVFRRRWPLTRSVGAAAAIFVMLCCRGESAQVRQPPPTDTVIVDKEVKIKVEGDRLSVQPEIFVAKVNESITQQGLDAMKDLTTRSEALEARIDQLDKEGGTSDQIKELAAQIEELAKKEESVKKEGPASWVTIGGPGVAFVVEGLRPGYSLEIDFRSQGNQKGPFLPRQAVPSRLRGRYVFHGRANAPIQTTRSGRVDIVHFPNPSLWKYEVVLRRGSEDLVAIDPMGVLK